jgi:hypothetical protein
VSSTGQPASRGLVAVSDEQRPVGRELLFAGLHLWVLWAFAVAQPMFGVLSDSPEFFVARDNTAGDIVALAFALTFLPPLLLLALEAAFMRAPSVRRMVHLVLIGLLAAGFAVQLAKGTIGSSAAVLVPAAAIGGIAVAMAYARLPAVRSIATVLSPAPLAFLAFFLLASPVAKLVLPQDAAAVGSASGAEAPIVMVVFDEFASTALTDRRGRINAERHPNFAALAATSTWYPNAVAVADFTPLAVPAILTGRIPKGGTVPIASELPDSLFTLLGRGYDMHVEEPVTALCPESLCARKREPASERLGSLTTDLSVVALRRLAPANLEDDLPAVDEGFEDFGGARAEAVRRAGGGDVDLTTVQHRSRSVARFLERIRAPGRKPTLDFLHVTLPHLPWEFLPSGQQYTVPGLVAPGRLVGDVWARRQDLVRQAEQRYLLQVGYTDRLLGRLIRRLREVGLYDRALVVIAADHGVSFKAGQPRRNFTRATAGEIAPVPLFVKAPGQRRGRIDQSRIRTVDILPTMAEELGVELDWPTEPPVDDVTMRGTTVSFAELELLRQEVRNRQADAFGRSVEDLFAWSVAPLPATAASSRTRVELDGSFEDVDPSAPLVPAFVTGRLLGEAFAKVQIAVNGRAGPVVSTFPERGDTRFAAIISPSLLRRGANDVRVLGVEGDRRVTLRR